MNLLRALFAVSSLTLVSRILGYVRDFIIARAFGAGLATDAFFVAFRIPNLLRRLFAEGAFSQAFVPVLAEHKNRTSPEETRALIDGVATALLVALAAGIFNTWNRFAIPAITPALLNVSFIVAALFFADRFDPPILALAWG